MICETCKEAAATWDMSLHRTCKGESWCDCQHKERVADYDTPIVKESC